MCRWAEAVAGPLWTPAHDFIRTFERPRRVKQQTLCLVHINRVGFCRH